MCSLYIADARDLHLKICVQAAVFSLEGHALELTISHVTWCWHERVLFAIYYQSTTAVLVMVRCRLCCSLVQWCWWLAPLTVVVWVNDPCTIALTKPLHYSPVPSSCRHLPGLNLLTLLCSPFIQAACSVLLHVVSCTCRYTSSCMTVCVYTNHLDKVHAT